MLSIPRVQLQIDWNEIEYMQTKNLRSGINKVGIPDLLIAQNAIQNNVPLFTCDKHFLLMKALFPLQLFEENF